MFATYLAPPALFEHYQLLRNLSHLTEGDTLVLLLPRANRSTFRQADRFFAEAVLPAWRSRVRLVALEDLLGSLVGSSPNADTAKALEALREKYLARAV